MRTNATKFHGSIQAMQGLKLDNNADIVATPGLFATVGGVPCVYTTIDEVEAWYPLAKGIDSATYRHVQTILSDHWVVPHELGTEDVWYIIRDSDGDIVATTTGVDFDETDPTNILHFHFAVPITGSVFIIGTKAFTSPLMNTTEINLGNGVSISSGGIQVDTDLVTMESLVAAQQTLSGLVDAVATEITRAQGVEDGLIATATTHGSEIDSINTELTSLSASTLKQSDLSSNGGELVQLVLGKIPASQLPSYVDDVLEYNYVANFPATGETGKIYVAVNARKIYRWSGSVYVEISASPGSTDEVTEGSTNLYFTAARAQAAVTTITGNAGTATKLQTPRTIAVSGDVSGSANFDGSSNITIAATLSNNGVPAGTYGDNITVPSITVDGKGLVTNMVGNAIRVASTTQTGVVQLSSATDSTSTALAATASAVKAAYDLANAAVPASQKGIANGVATLDTNGFVPASQLPGSTVDILEYLNLGAFPVTGTVSKIYVAQNTNRIYRWNGTAYVEISASPANTDSVTEGATNLYFTNARAQAAVTTITGNAGTATKLATARTISTTGAATGSASFDGSANASIALTLATSGVTAGQYGGSVVVPVVTVNDKGLVTNVSNVAIANGDTTQVGLVRLSSVVNSTSNTLAATASAVKTAFDQAVAANNLALTAIQSTQKGAVNGVASLDASGLVPTSQLPSYVDDVLEYNALANFPGTGTAGKIYVALDTGKIYRWSGSVYVEISASPGSTDSVVEGATNLYFTAARAQAAVTSVSGNAGTATKLATSRSIAVSGDIAGSANFDGSANITIAATLANSGVTAGEYPVVTLNAKGIATAARAMALSDLPAGTAKLATAQSWTKGQRGTIVPVTYAATLTLDFDLGNNFETTLTGNTTLGLPSNIQPGQSGVFKVVQDATGNRTMAFNSVFKFVGGTVPTLSTTAGAVDNLCYFVEASDRIMVTQAKNVK